CEAFSVVCELSGGRVERDWRHALRARTQRVDLASTSVQTCGRIRALPQVAATRPLYVYSGRESRQRRMAQHTFQCGRSVGSPTGRVLTSLVNTFCGLRRCIWGCEGRWLDGIASAALEGKLLVMGSPRTSASDRKSTRLNSSHVKISYAVFC